MFGKIFSGNRKIFSIGYLCLMFTSSSSSSIILPFSRIAYKNKFSPSVTFKTLSFLIFKKLCISSMALLNDILFFRKDPNINKFPREISSIFSNFFFL